MIAANMGRALYSSEVQQPERTTPALCDCGQAEQPGEAAAGLGRADVLHPDGQPHSDETHRAESAHIAATRFTVVGNRHLQDDPAPVEPGTARRLTVVSDFGSETGAASRVHMWPDAVSLTARSALNSAYTPHQVCYSNVCAFRDEEATGSNRPLRPVQ
jgi:hypothetical protein